MGFNRWFRRSAGQQCAHRLLGRGALENAAQPAVLPRQLGNRQRKVRERLGDERSASLDRLCVLMDGTAWSCSTSKGKLNAFSGASQYSQ